MSEQRYPDGSILLVVPHTRGQWIDPNIGRLVKVVGFASASASGLYRCEPMADHGPLLSLFNKTKVIGAPIAFSPCELVPPDEGIAALYGIDLKDGR